jgi:hypothetical protein
VIFVIKLLNSRTLLTLKNSVVILLTSVTYAASLTWQPQWPQQPPKPFFPQKMDDSISPGETKMTNTGPFLWIGSSKIQNFTDIWQSFCQRLLRPASTTFFKID